MTTTTYHYKTASGPLVVYTGQRAATCGECVNYTGSNGCGFIFKRSANRPTEQCHYAVQRPTVTP
jgi:hypothetical protein